MMCCSDIMARHYRDGRLVVITDDETGEVLYDADQRDEDIARLANEANSPDEAAKAVRGNREAIGKSDKEVSLPDQAQGNKGGN